MPPQSTEHSRLWSSHVTVAAGEGVQCVTLNIGYQLYKALGHHENQSLACLWEGFCIRFTEVIRPSLNIGSIVPWAGALDCMNSWAPASLSLCSLTPGGMWPATSPSRCAFPTMMDCVHVNCEPRQTLQPLSCFCQEFYQHNKKSNSYTMCPLFWNLFGRKMVKEAGWFWLRWPCLTKGHRWQPRLFFWLGDWLGGKRETESHTQCLALKQAWETCINTTAFGVWSLHWIDQCNFWDETLPISN